MKKNFSKIVFASLISVYALIFIGGVVRSTGSGMGCPDWPKCFGNWVPPTKIEQLPENYRETYSNMRAEKNERFMKYLNFLGFNHLAEEIKNDRSILVEDEFNAAKTWTEYFNRLAGVIVGFFILITFIASFSFLKEDRFITLLAGINLLLVIFQGWIGSVVVSTKLVPWVITIHMLLALVIVGLIIYIMQRSKKLSPIEVSFNKVKINLIIILCALTTIVQIVLGTQVREAMDEIAAAFNYTGRQYWISQMDSVFFIHRSFSIFVLIIHAVLMYWLFKNFRKGKVYNYALTLFLLIIAEIVSGVIMTYFNVPTFIQPLHLLLSALVFGSQFLIFLEINPVAINNERLAMSN